MEKTEKIKKDASNLPPVALILAGYDKVDKKTKMKKKQEIIESYDGDEIYIGNNKFLYELGGKPVIQYVLDAVFKAEKNGKPLYDKIYLYNDVKSFEEVIDVSKYPNLKVVQMTDSVGGHWKDFYFNHIDYGQRVDVFFGDTPRITSDDAAWLHEQYSKVLGVEKDQRGIIKNMLFGIVRYQDMEDNWLMHRIKFVKRGHNKGKLKNFVGLTDSQVRVGNSGALIKHHGMDGLMEKESVNFLYNIRKALTPSNFSKILFLLWKMKYFDLVRQVKNKCINQDQMSTALINIIASIDKIDLSEYGGSNFVISKNACRWENDIDGPLDLAEFRKREKELV